MRVAGIDIVGFAASVPRSRECVGDIEAFQPGQAEKFTRVTGILERRIAGPDTFVSDLVFAAAKQLLTELSLPATEIDALITITQSGDNAAPGVALKVSSRLGLAQKHIAFDVNLGCSSFPYGIALVSSLMKSLGLRFALLCIGDISSRLCHKSDLSTYPLFGDAGSAILLKRNLGSEREFHFDLNSDGSGREDIYVEGGGLSSMAPPLQISLEQKTRSHMQLKGANVFSFAISKAPESIRRVLSSAGTAPDICILHQANKKINKFIEDELALGDCQFPQTLQYFGNTSSVTIPLTVVANYGGQKLTALMIACGFGVGLSWGTVLLELHGCHICELAEI